jgi:hypothetical protein
MLDAMLDAMPSMRSGYKWNLVYSLARHGATLETMLSRCKGVPATMLVVQDQNGFVFGSFSAEPWKFSTSYYGNGMSYVYSFFNGNKTDVSKFKYVAWRQLSCSGLRCS